MDIFFYNNIKNSSTKEYECFTMKNNVVLIAKHSFSAQKTTTVAPLRSRLLIRLVVSFCRLMILMRIDKKNNVYD